MSAGRAPARRWRAAALVGGLAMVAGCSSSGPTPEQARRDRVEERLQETFTKTQASCILGRSDDRVLVALDRSGDLPGDDAAMEAYSDAVVACVSDTGDGAETTTTAPATEGTSR